MRLFSLSSSISVWFFCIFLSYSSIFGSEKFELSQQEDIEELRQLFFDNQKTPNVARKYATKFLKKAKRENDKILIADGYHYLFILSTPDVAIKYVDSIIELTMNLSTLNYPSRGYLNKGVLLANNKKHNEALDYYLKAKYYAKKNNNKIHQVAAAINIAQLKRKIGKEDEALNVYKMNYSFLKDKDIYNKFYRPYLGTILGIAAVYNKQKKLDSATTYLNEGFELISKSKENYSYSGLLLLNAMNDYDKEKYTTAIDSLKKMLGQTWLLEKNAKLAEAHLMLAKCYDKTKKPILSLTHLENVDELVNVHNYSYRTREAFEMLLINYKKQQTTQKQLHILEKLIKLDSVANTNDNKLNIEIYQKYDTDKLIKEKNEILKNLQRQEHNSTILYFVLAGIIIGGAFFLYKNYTKQIYYKKRFDLLIKDVNDNKKPEKIIDSPKSLDIPKEVIDSVLIKLEKFEEQKKFIDSKVTSIKLAKKLGTNSTYLSKIINLYKGQNFANYINDLRIDFAIDQLKNNSTFRKYTIKSIAEEIGFNNVQSFSKAFYKKTGIKPSYFIKKIENQ